MGNAGQGCARKEMFILTPLGRQVHPGYQREPVPVF